MTSDTTRGSQENGRNQWTFLRALPFKSTSRQGKGKKTERERNSFHFREEVIFGLVSVVFRKEDATLPRYPAAAPFYSGKLHPDMVLPPPPSPASFVTEREQLPLSFEGL